jgi:predicted RNA-binding Zn-ribbon protein involved in translation (DUF1610 family)
MKFQKTTLVTMVIILMANLTYAQPEPAENCPIGKCAKCSYINQDYNCEDCHFSSRVKAPAKEGEEEAHFTCSEENNIKIENCNKLALDDATGLSDPTKCDTCE